MIEVDPVAYPETVNSFVFLASEGFFDGTVFHRVAADFVIQGGDPTPPGPGGPDTGSPTSFLPKASSTTKGSWRWQIPAPQPPAVNSSSS